MKHFIIVKFEDKVDFRTFIDPIKKLFDKALNIDGVNKIDILVSNSTLTNRYDLMIKMELTQRALIEFDNSKIHSQWKEQYGKYIKNKVIFDCE